jgi:hypothetical protein
MGRLKKVGQKGSIPKDTLRFGRYMDKDQSTVAAFHLVQALFPGLSFVREGDKRLYAKINLTENDGEKLPNVNLNMGHGNDIDADTVDTKHADDFILKAAGYNVVSKDILYNDSSPQLIVQAKDGWIVKDVWVEVTTAWNTESNVDFTIGTMLDADGFFDAVANMNLLATGYGGYNVDERGVFLWDSINSHVKQYVCGASMALNVVINAGDAMQGAATVYLGIVRAK